MFFFRLGIFQNSPKFKTFQETLISSFPEKKEEKMKEKEIERILYLTNFHHYAPTVRVLVIGSIMYKYLYKFVDYSISNKTMYIFKIYVLFLLVWSAKSLVLKPALFWVKIHST